MRASTAYSSITAGFPTTVYAPAEGKDYDVYAGTTSESGTVPAGLYLYLNYRPQRTTLAITLDGVAASLVEWGVTPSAAGVVAVSYVSGQLRFHAGDVGKTAAATYSHLGSVIDSTWWNTLQKELAATQQWLADTNPGQTLTGMFPGTVDAITTAGQEHRFTVPGVAGKTWKLSSLQITGCDALSSAGTTTVTVSTKAIGGEGASTIAASAAVGAWSSAQATASITVTTGDTLYVFVTAAGSHAWVQYRAYLEAIG